MEGLLGGFDPEQLKQLMAQFGATPQDTADANKQAAFALGFGLLQGRKGNELATIGQAGLGAMGARQASLANSGQLRQQGLQNAMGMAKLAQAAQAQQGAAQQAQELAGAFGAGGPPPLPPAPMGPPDAGGAMSQQLPPLPAQPSATSQADQYRAAAVIYAKQGNSEAAKRMMDIANSMEAEYNTIPQMSRGPDGSIQPVLIGKRGETKTLPYLPAEKLSFHDTGGGIAGLNPYTGKQEMPALPKTISPDTQFTGGITMRGQNMTDARARELNANQAGAGEIKETDSGFVRIGKDNTVTPIVAGGAQVQPKPTGAVQQQIANNAVMINKLDRAIKLVSDKPDAFGSMNYIGDAVRQRTDPGGVEARSLVADIAGQKIHDRAGASQTVTEVERLKPYIPNITDSPATILKKLPLFRQEYTLIQKELQGGKSLSAVAGGNTGGATGGWSIKEVK